MNLTPIFFPKNLAEVKQSSRITSLFVGIFLFFFSLFMFYDLAQGVFSYYRERGTFLFLSVFFFVLSMFLCSILCLFAFFFTNKIQSYRDFMKWNKVFVKIFIVLLGIPPLFCALACLPYSLAFSIRIFFVSLIGILSLIFIQHQFHKKLAIMAKNDGETI